MNEEHKSRASLRSRRSHKKSRSASASKVRAIVDMTFQQFCK